MRDLRRATAHPARKAIAGLSEMLGESGMLAYLSYMALRLPAMKRLLKPTGSIYLHCDPTASHYLKALMDAVFGAANFMNEITWKRYAVHSLAETGFNNVADVSAGVNEAIMRPPLKRRGLPAPPAALPAAAGKATHGRGAARLPLFPDVAP